MEHSKSKSAGGFHHPDVSPCLPRECRVGALLDVAGRRGRARAEHLSALSALARSAARRRLVVLVVVVEDEEAADLDGAVEVEAHAEAGAT